MVGGVDLRSIQEKVLYEKDGVVVSQAIYTEVIEGKSNQCIMTRKKGLHYVTTITGEEVLCDESATFDRGPKLGVGLCFTRHRDWTPEETAALEARIKRTAADVVRRMQMGLNRPELYERPRKDEKKPR